MTLPKENENPAEEAKAFVERRGNWAPTLPISTTMSRLAHQERRGPSKGSTS